VYESERTRVTRVSCAEGSGIRKEPLGPDAEHRLRNEVAILERLRGVEGVVQLAEAPRYPGSIVLVAVGGSNLAGLAKPLAVDDLIELAVQLAEAVARMHRRGVTALPSRHLTQDSCIFPQQNGVIGNEFDEEGS
jgi:tRNA A-37 threonylcarbamoyl transferase component Bud32